MSAAATVPSSGTTPTVLVVGFDADQILRKRYEGQALFNTSGPEAIMRPDHIPAGVAAVFMRSGVLRVHQERISNLCEAGGRRCLFEILGSLPLLRDRLEEYFTPFPPARPDEDLARIRALNCRSGSQSAWIRDRMNYPCNYKVEADRLLPELRAQVPHASTDYRSPGRLAWEQNRACCSFFSCTAQLIEPDGHEYQKAPGTA